MDDIWIISWFNHTACDANPIWKSLKTSKEADFETSTTDISLQMSKSYPHRGLYFLCFLNFLYMYMYVHIYIYMQTVN